jgi:hypothetical protein
MVIGVVLVFEEDLRKSLSFQGSSNFFISVAPVSVYIHERTAVYHGYPTL